MSWHPIIRRRSRAMVRREHRAAAARPVPTPRARARVEGLGAQLLVLDARTHTAVSDPIWSPLAVGSDTAPQTAAGRVEIPTPARSAAPNPDQERRCPVGKDKDDDKQQRDEKQDKGRCCDSVLHMYGDPMDSERD